LEIIAIGKQARALLFYFAVFEKKILLVFIGIIGVFGFTVEETR